MLKVEHHDQIHRLGDELCCYGKSPYKKRRRNNQIFHFLHSWFTLHQHSLWCYFSYRHFVLDLAQFSIPWLVLVERIPRSSRQHQRSWNWRNNNYHTWHLSQFQNYYRICKLELGYKYFLLALPYVGTVHTPECTLFNKVIKLMPNLAPCILIQSHIKLQKLVFRIQEIWCVT